MLPGISRDYDQRRSVHYPSRLSRNSLRRRAFLPIIRNRRTRADLQVFAMGRSGVFYNQGILLGLCIVSAHYHVLMIASFVENERSDKMGGSRGQGATKLCIRACCALGRCREFDLMIPHDVTYSPTPFYVLSLSGPRYGILHRCWRDPGS